MLVCGHTEVVSPVQTKSWILRVTRLKKFWTFEKWDCSFIRPSLDWLRAGKNFREPCSKYLNVSLKVWWFLWFGLIVWCISEISGLCGAIFRDIFIKNLKYVNNTRRYQKIRSKLKFDSIVIFLSFSVNELWFIITSDLPSASKSLLTNQIEIFTEVILNFLYIF